MDETAAEESLALLKKGIIEIQNGNASNLRFEELYRKAYTLVLHKHGRMLYDGVEEVIVNKLEETAQILDEKNSDVLVDSIIREWEDHVTKMGMIRDILMYMDKTSSQQKDHIPVYDLGLLKFLENVLHYSDLILRIRTKLLNNILAERNNTIPHLNRRQMRNCLRILIEVDVRPQHSRLYVTEFEDHFIQESKDFYKKESSDALAQNSIGDYLKRVETRMDEEIQRASKYLDFEKTKTRQRLMTVVDNQLMISQLDYIIENNISGFIVMLRDDRTADLSRLYTLCHHVDKRKEKRENISSVDSDDTCLGKLGNVMKKYVYDEGVAIVDDPENRQKPQRFVEQVLYLLEKHTNQVTHCFKERPSFTRKLTDTFTEFINKGMFAAKYLSMFVDNTLRSHENNVDINKSLDDVMVLFKYIKDKDIFEDFYRSQLSSRLLQGKTANDEIERNMIARLKQECGYQYTSKLEGMFRDIQTSKDVQKNWKQHLRERCGGEMDIEFTCQVLTAGTWPLNSQCGDCRLPDEILACQSMFNDFYKNKNEGRKLTYNLTQGNAVMIVDFDAGNKELVVTTFQMCILMLFNRKEIWRFSDIIEETQIPREELCRNILSLAHPKVKVLLKKPNVKNLQDNHEFKFNYKYKNPRYKIQLPTLKKGNTQQAETMPSTVQEQRKNRVEAAIVRIMKSRKTLNHNQLVSELIKQLSAKFQPEPSFLKKRIESLIEREFLERDNNDWRTYRYLA